MKYQQQHNHSNKGVPVGNIIHHSNKIYNYFKTLKLGQFLSDVYLTHLMTIIVSVFCIVDDTIASYTKSLSQDVHPIEAAHFHPSHLKDRQDYGHQAVSVILSCNGIILNYAVILCDKSKIQIVQEIAVELPTAPVIFYFLCDSWHTTAKVMDSFIRTGFYTIGALKTNRIIYPCGIVRKPVNLLWYYVKSWYKLKRNFFC